jgi:hypothetical protein
MSKFWFWLKSVLSIFTHFWWTCPYLDETGHAINDGEKYIRGRYLEVSTFNNRYHEYNIGKKNNACPTDVMFFPQVPTILKTDKKVRVSNDIILELGIRSSNDV